MASLISNVLNSAAPWLLGIGGFLGLSLYAGYEYIKRHSDKDEIGNPHHPA